MALPKINVLPNFELTIPSTGKTLKVRPYLVKEEKMMLLAFESKDPKQIINIMIDTIKSCAESDIDVNKLTTFDVEYIFTKIRAKSVGEVIKLNMTCDNDIEDENGEKIKCNHSNEVKFNIDEITIEDVSKVNKNIKLTDEVSLDLKYPTYKDLTVVETMTEDVSAEDMFRLITTCIDAICTTDNRFDTKDQTDLELEEFVESLSSAQFSMITEFLNTMPKMKTHIVYQCEKCDKQHDLIFEGLTDFF